MANEEKKEVQQKEGKTIKTRLSQNSLPSFTLEDALKIAKALKDNFAGQPTAPLLVAEACGISPTSSNWRYLAGCSVAYGITDGGYNAQSIKLTALGDRIVSPLKEGDDLLAMRQAVLVPTIFGDFYQTYNGNKLPRKDIGLNVLQKKGVPVERLESTWDILKKNATFVGILRVISGNEYIYLENAPAIQSDNDVDVSQNETKDNIPTDLMEKLNISQPQTVSVAEIQIPKRDKPNIFISHGKNSQTIVGQLKELLSYGQMVPIVSIERETTAVPVPDKVFDDMRNCDAGIINIEAEMITTDSGDIISRLNENVLIEIGAAIALYQKKVILLCKKGTLLPSNLQGLYRCEYEGNQLDYAATMKLLKTMQELRNLM